MAQITFKKINGWSFKTADNLFMISNCGPRQWFSAQIDAEASEKFGWAIPLEDSKVYHSRISEAQAWISEFHYSETGAVRNA